MPRKQVGTNKKARHEYLILDTFEAGIVLTGSEVKALREGRLAMTDGYARFIDDELWLHNVHIGEYSHRGYGGHDALRKRKLLLNHRELKKIRKALIVKGQTAVPVSLYFKGGWAKLELAIGRGKRQYDKRRTIAERDSKRRLARITKTG